MIQYIDRETKKIALEPVWGKSCIDWLYKERKGLVWAQNAAASLLSIPLFSHLWGAFHNCTYSKKQIASFCTKFQIDTSEFERPIDQYLHFNDFFTRSLKPSARPHDLQHHSVLIPADARYSYCNNIGPDTQFLVKGVSFNIARFLGLQHEHLVKKFVGGTFILARLCPLDCHRFYFPLEGTAQAASSIQGPLFSVNPVATHQRPWIFWTNKRKVTIVETKESSCYAMVEIGATNCGSIVQTFAPGHVEKGQEKGYFQLGGSSIGLLFQPGTFTLAQDIKDLSQQGLEVYCKIGQQLGTFHPLSEK